MNALGGDTRTRLALGDICRLRSEQIDPAHVSESRYVGLEHIESSNSTLRAWGRASDVKSNKSRFHSGDVLFGKLRPYLRKSVLVDFDGICSTDILVLAPDTTRLEPSFLASLTQSRDFVEHAIRTTGGVNLPRTSWSALREFEFDLPALAEQRAIAGVLRAVQTAKDARRRKLALEHEHKTALMAHLFTHGARGEQRINTQLGPLPKSWKVMSLGECVEFFQYGTSRRCEETSLGLPVLRIPNVVTSEIDTTDLKYLADPDGEAESLRLAEGDLLFVRTNGQQDFIGRCAMYRGQPDNSLFASYLIRARMKPLLLPGFVQIYTLTETGRSFLSGRASNAADGKFNINTQTLRQVVIPVPELSEQRTIEQAIDLYSTSIRTTEAEVVHLEELFRGLLEELMSGRLPTTAISREEAIR